MIKLQNVNKIYVSKSKQEVNALKDINLEIDDCGMVFILGKSGSGKSTLLNILGGIDSASSGKIYVDGTSLERFKQADFDGYRNQYVGFVFQEFNLLSDFNVRENVSIALQLSKEESVTEKVINALNQVELSADYLTRKIDELSGGEKQRVAIARAVVKNSQMILADEPTGSLDTATGGSVWNILKNLSKTKLVVIVTHDRESAEQCGDRIIEIADGGIVADSGKQPLITAERKKFEPKKQRLSPKVVFKMGMNNLLQKKVKAISVVLLAVFTIFSLLLMQMTLTFSSEKTFAKFIKDNNVDYIQVTQGKEAANGGFGRYSNLLKLGTKEFLASNSNLIHNGIIQGKQDILDFGLSFIGEPLELDEMSWYLTDQKLEEFYESEKSYVVIDEQKVKLVKEFHPIDFLIGKKVVEQYVGEQNYEMYTLAGVVKTSDKSELSKDAFPQYFALKEFKGAFSGSDTTVNRKSREIDLQFGQTHFSETFNYHNELTSGSGGGESKVLTAEGLKSLYNDGITLADDEVVLSYELYAKLFDAQSKWSYVDIGLTEVYTFPQDIGSYFDLNLYEYESGLQLADLGKLKVVGIVFTAKADPNNLLVNNLMVSKITARKVCNALNPLNEIVIQVASIENLEKFLVDFRKNHSGAVVSIGYETVEFQGHITKKQYTDEIYGFAYHLQTFKIIFLIMAVLLSGILVLMVINLISASIINRKKEIGILSALGTTGKDLVKIFMIETLIISAITYIINQIAVISAIEIWNSIFSSSFLIHIPLFLVNFWTFFTPIISAFGLLLTAALIPVRKIIKLKPIDAIKNL